VDFVQTIREQYCSVETGIEGAYLIDLASLHFHPAQRFVPDTARLFFGLIKGIVSNLALQIQLRLLETDKRRGHPGMNYFVAFRCEPHHSPRVVSFHLLLTFEQLLSVPRAYVGERLVENNNEVIFEIRQLSARVFRAVPNDLVLLGNDLYIRPCVKSINNNEGAIRFREGKAELGRSFCRGYLRCHIVVSEINAV